MSGNVTEPGPAALHDAYAAEYDDQVRASECYLAEVLFGLIYERLSPGERALDLGIGSGLAAAPLARVGLQVYGVDFSPAMLDLCRAKGIAAELKQHDLRDVPWPYPTAIFEHVVSCGLLHFIPDLEAIFAEAGRVTRPGGSFAFTTKAPQAGGDKELQYERQAAGDLEVYNHFPGYIEALMAHGGFERWKVLRCFVGRDLFIVWAARKPEEAGRHDHSG